MTVARSASVALVGMTPHLIEVEVDVSSGIPGFTLTALADRVLKQAEQRVKAAVANSGESWPGRRVTVAMSPASVPKSGSAFDVPIAVTTLAAAEELPAEPLGGLVLFGELALGGAVKPVSGVLPSVIGAMQRGVDRFVVPHANAQEALLVPGAQVWAVESLAQLCGWLRGFVDDDELRVARDPEAVVPPDSVPDLADVVGQAKARRALEIAAAGGHHLLMSGPPGVGKTMLAERLPGILPPLTDAEAMEVTAIHSVAGRLAPGRPLITQPPFSAPHHSASVAAVVGGGSGIAGPGEISLAHRGVLFLDEAPEFSARLLDALRQPLESGRIVLNRANGAATYPAEFLLVLAANPCPCSAGGQSVDERQCVCPPAVRSRYRSRLSGPLRDRIDLFVELERVSRRVLAEQDEGEPTALVRARVEAARVRARDRLAGTRWTVNGDVPGPVLRRRWPIDARLLRAVGHAADRGRLSTRGIDRVLRVAWTLTDLAALERPGLEQIEEALEFRLGGVHPRPVAVPA